MKARDITEAIAANDRETMHQGFRALVDASEDMVEAASPGLLVVALNRLCAALADDDATMPSETCAALDLPAGASYADGAAQAKRDGARLARHLMTAG